MRKKSALIMQFLGFNASPPALPEPTREHDHKEILGYLRKGKAFAFPMLSRSERHLDLFTHRILPVGPGAWRTDGIWIWHTVFAYYLRTYQPSLPPEFLRHGRQTGWQMPIVTEDDLVRATKAFNKMTSVPSYVLTGRILLSHQSSCSISGRDPI